MRTSKFLLLPLLLLPLLASAQIPDVVGPFSPYPPHFNPYLPNPITGAPSLASEASAVGVRSTASSVAEIATKAGKIPVPITAAVEVSKSAIARAATATVGACVNPVGAVVCGVATAAAVGSALKAAGVGYGPCPDGTYAFICKVTPEQRGAPSLQVQFRESAYNITSGWFSTRTLACQDLLPKYPTVQGYYWKIDGDPESCRISQFTTGGSYVASRTPSATEKTACPGGVAPDTSKPLSQQCIITPQKVETPTPEQLEPTLQERMDADFQERMRLHDALMRDEAAALQRGDQWPEPRTPVKSDTPVQVDAPPASSPERVTKTTTKGNPDGSTDTITEKQKEVVAPKVTGTTVGDTKVEFPTQTITTISTTNNITNNTTITQTVENHPPVTPENKLDIPNDYAREATLQQLRDQVAADGAPNLPDQMQVVKDAEDDGKDKLKTMRDGAEGGVADDKNRFFSWVWTPPVGTCAPFAGTVHGHAISWDLCPTIENIRDVIGWLFAIFAAIEVYGQLFRRND